MPTIPFEPFKEDATSFYKKLNLRKFNETEAMGYGVERCLYELNPELVCLSPNLIHAAVLTPDEALKALEAVASQADRPSFPIDRHLGAFLMSRWKELGFQDLRDLGKPQREVRNLAALKILAGLQTHFKINDLPNLCQWMADLCAPLAAHYHNVKVRTHIQEEIAQAVSSGQLSNLVRIFENRQAMAQDHSDYQAAKIEVLLIQSEIKEIKSKIGNLNRIPFMRKGILGKMAGLWRQIKTVRSARKQKARMAHLHRQAEALLETWGVEMDKAGS